MTAAISARTIANGRPQWNAINEASQPPIPTGIINVPKITMIESSTTTDDATSGTV
jgi:hypothetical protein